MNTKYLYTHLELIGWRIETDEVGDKCAYFDLSDRYLRIIPDIRRIHGEQQIAASPTLSTDTFSKYLCKDKGQRVKLHPNGKGLE